MGFYEQSASVVWPVKVASAHGSGFTLSHDISSGAQLVPIPDGVDIQPQSEVRLDDQTRIATVTGFTLHTQPGCDLAIDPTCQIDWRGRRFTLTGDVHRWPSDDYPSGVDHVTLTMEQHNG